MTSYRKILEKNKAWAKHKLDIDPEYFSRLVHVQSPEFLWIGCSDSRVPADQITGTEPGEIFVHRNIANVVDHTDLNVLSVLTYAVDVLKVKHIIICGHYNCGGVKAALYNDNHGLLNKWLRNIKDVYVTHKIELEAEQDPSKKLDMLVEFNVIEQAHNLAQTTVMQQAWHQKQEIKIHGCVYSLEDGIMRDLIEIKDNESIDEIYRLKF